MDPSQFFKNLTLDTWYKALIYLGGGVFVISLFVDVKGVMTNPQLQLLSGGVFIFGVGEWKNHKIAAWIKPPNAYTGGAAFVQVPVRSADHFGRLLDLAGIVLISIAIWRVIQYSIILRHH